MNITPTCIVCILTQTLRVAKAIGANEQTTKDILEQTLKASLNFSYSQTPPKVATAIYENISKLTKKYDLYEELKKESIKSAKSYVPIIKEYIENSQNRFLASIKSAIAGNVIDFASEYDFDLKDEIYKIFETKLAIDDSAELFIELKKSKKILYLADNAGENIFDEFLLKYIKENFDIEIFYAVRNKPIINDLTIKDLEGSEIFTYANIVNSGVSSPGLILNEASKEFQKLFNEVDFVISKGMGNFECLEENRDKKIFFLFKVKCSVVANFLNKSIGDIVCKLNMNYE